MGKVDLRHQAMITAQGLWPGKSAVNQNADLIEAALTDAHDDGDEQGYTRGKFELVEAVEAVSGYTRGWDEALMEAKTAVLLSGCKDGSIHTEAILRLKKGQGK